MAKGPGRRTQHDSPDQPAPSRRGVLRSAAIVGVAAGVSTLLIRGRRGPGGPIGVPVGKIAGPDALPPFLTPVDEFYRYSNGPPPAPLAASAATLLIGPAGRPRQLTWTDLLPLAATKRVVTLQCDGNGYEAARSSVGCQTLPDETSDHPPAENWPWRYGGIGTAEWDTISVADLYAALDFPPPRGWLYVEGRDGYRRFLPAEQAADLFVAVGMNGQPLPHGHGAPARLLVPGQYGAMNIKWLSRLTSGEYDDARPFDGGAETRYPVKPIAFATAPVEGATVSGAELTLFGGAFAGAHAVKEVLLWVHPADLWTAELIDPPAAGVWTRWRSVVQIPAGEHALHVACVDEGGRHSVPQSAYGDAVGYGGYHVLNITVT